MRKYIFILFEDKISGQKLGCLQVFSKYPSIFLEGIRSTDHSAFP